jgi:predicted HicB family RNase H-like nuclease
MPLTDNIVSTMTVRRQRLKEAESREGMRSFNVWLPVEMHQALAQARAEEGVSLNEAIREAVRAWITRRKAARKRSNSSGRQRR